MGIPERHRGGRMPQEVADGGQWDALHDQPGGEGMAEVMEVEIRQAGALTGRIKGVPDIIPPTPCCIVKDPRHVLPRS